MAKDKKYRKEKDRFERFETQRQELFKINKLQEIGVNDLQDSIYFELARRYGITDSSGIISFKKDTFELESMIDRVATNFIESTKWELDRLNESDEGTSLFFRENSYYIINRPKFKEFADTALSSIKIPFDTIRELYDGLHLEKNIDDFKDDIEGTNLQGLSSLQWVDEVYESVFHKYGKLLGLSSNEYGTELINRDLVKSLKLNLDKGSPFLKEEKESGPLNAGAEKSTFSNGSPVNPASGEKKAVAEKSTVNPATTPAVETSVEKTADTVTGAPAVLPKEAEAPKPSTAINISIETPKPDAAPKKEEAPAQVVPSEKTEVVNTPVMLAQPTSTPTAQTATAAKSTDPAKSSPVNAEEIKKKEAENNKVLAGVLGLGSTSESKTNVTSSTQTINSPSNTQSSKSTETSAVNQTTSNTALNNSNTSSSTQNTANSSGIMSDINQLMLNKSSALTNKYFGSIFSSDEKKKPSEPENISVTEPTAQSNSEKVEANPTEVSKTAPSFPEKIQPSSEKIIEKANTKVLEKTQEMMNQKESIKSETSMGSGESYSTITPAGPDAMSSDQPKEKPSSGTSMAGVESRLARLEYLLSNPLEVKIIE